MIEDIKNIINNAEKYTAHNGKVCFRTFGNLDYYFLMCNKFGIEPRTASSGLSYEGENDLIEFDYCEHDIIIHIKKILVKAPFSGWHEVSKEQATKWAKAIYNGANHKENALKKIKENILGIEFNNLKLI